MQSNKEKERRIKTKISQLRLLLLFVVLTYLVYRRNITICVDSLAHCHQQQSKFYYNLYMLCMIHSQIIIDAISLTAHHIYGIVYVHFPNKNDVNIFLLSDNMTAIRLHSIQFDFLPPYFSFSLFLNGFVSITILRNEWHKRQN